METETNGLMDFLTTLATVEEIFLEAVNDLETIRNRLHWLQCEHRRNKDLASQGSCMRLIRPISELSWVYEEISLAPPIQIVTHGYHALTDLRYSSPRIPHARRQSSVDLMAGGFYSPLPAPCSTSPLVRGSTSQMSARSLFDFYSSKK